MNLVRDILEDDLNFVINYTLLLIISINYSINYSNLEIVSDVILYGVRQRSIREMTGVCGGFREWCTASCFSSSISLPVWLILLLFSNALSVSFW